MNSFEATLLGIIQGLTEFLPVSSSGHLVIFQKLFGLSEPQLFFDITLHVGTLVATIIVFHKAIFRVLFIPRAILLLVVGSIPVAVVGFSFLEVIEHSFGSMLAAGVGLLITGTWLWFTRYVPRRTILMDNFIFSEITFKKALAIGVAQSIALFPGISRSGMTIATALFLQTGRQDAATFSFLLSIPGIMGAVGLKLYKDGFAIAHSEMHTYITGFVLSLIVGTGALLYLINLVKKGRLFAFRFYCWIVGTGAIVLSYYL